MRSYNTFANRGRDFEDFVIQVNDLYGEPRDRQRRRRPCFTLDPGTFTRTL